VVQQFVDMIYFQPHCSESPSMMVHVSPFPSYSRISSIILYNYSILSSLYSTVGMYACINKILTGSAFNLRGMIRHYAQSSEHHFLLSFYIPISLCLFQPYHPWKNRLYNHHFIFHLVISTTLHCHRTDTALLCISFFRFSSFPP
jgi:hypothetical protein